MDDVKNTKRGEFLNGEGDTNKCVEFARKAEEESGRCGCGRKERLACTRMGGKTVQAAFLGDAHGHKLKKKPHTMCGREAVEGASFIRERRQTTVYNGWQRARR